MQDINERVDKLLKLNKYKARISKHRKKISKTFLVVIKDIIKSKAKKLNKFSIILISILILFLFVANVNSGTRKITKDQETMYTKIWNTDGNLWEVTGPNIQNAINDMMDGNDECFGTVYIGSDLTLTDTIQMRRYVDVDFLGHTVILDDDIPFVNFTGYNGYGVKHSSIKNAHVVVSNEQTQPIIRFDPNASAYSYSVRFNTVENIYIENPSSLDSKNEWVEHNYTGIYVDASYSTQLHNTFRNIHMAGVKYGFYFDGKANGWSNGCLFENIIVDQFETLMKFYTDSTWQYLNQNLFYNVKGIASSYTTYGIIDIGRNGNHFDHVMIENLDAASGLIYEYSTKYGIYPFFNLCMWHDDGSYFDNNVASTMIISNGKIQQEYGGG